MPLRISARFMPDCMAAFLTKYSHFRGEVIPPNLVRPISRPMAAENTAWSYNAGGTRSQRDLVIWRSLRVRRGACPVMTRRDHRKPISMKKGRTHNSPDHALRPEERRSGGRLHLGTMDGLKSECLDGFRLDEVDGFVGILNQGRKQQVGRCSHLGSRALSVQTGSAR